MTMTLGEVASLVGGTLDGDPSILISDAGTLRESKEGFITLAESVEFLAHLQASQASAAIVSLDFPTVALPVIRVESPLQQFGELVRCFRRMMKPPKVGVDSRAIVDPSACIHETASISAGCVIGEDVVIAAGVVVLPNAVIMDGTTIGERSVIFPNVVLYENTQVGRGCIVHAGAVLGSYGFGYESSSVRHELSVQYGYVVLEDEVEVGANTTIDRGTFGVTRVGQGTKIDNLVQIGHNCLVGEHNLLCAHTGIAGSVVTGQFVVMGGQVGVKDHVEIASHVQLAGRSGAMRSLDSPGVYSGTPGVPLAKAMKELVAVSRLPELLKQVKKLQRQVDQLSDAATDDDDPTSQQDAA